LSTGTVVRHNGVIGMSLLTSNGEMTGKLGVSDFIPKNVTNTEYGIIIAHIRVMYEEYLGRKTRVIDSDEEIVIDWWVHC